MVRRQQNKTKQKTQTLSMEISISSKTVLQKKMREIKTVPDKQKLILDLLCRSDKGNPSK